MSVIAPQTCCGAVLLRYAYEYAKSEGELTKEQLAYVRDEIDKLERAKTRVEKERAKAVKRNAKREGAK